MELKGPIKAKEPTTVKGPQKEISSFSATPESRMVVNII